MKMYPTLRESDGGNGEANGGGGSPTPAPAGTTLLAGAAGSSQQQQAAPSTWSWADESGKLSEGWRERLGGELGTSPTLAPIQTIEDLAKSYHATKAMVGQKLEMPAADASPERWAAWRKVTGAPEKPEGYRGDAKSLRPDVLPEDGWDMQAENQFLAIAHKHGLPPQAVKEIMGFYGDTLVGGLKQSQADESAMIEQETMALRKEWGQQFDARLSDAARIAHLAGLNPATNPIFTRSEVVKGFAGLARLIQGDSAVKGEQQGLGVAIGDRIRDITDPKSSLMLAREYRGEFGNERQAAAQGTLHQLMQNAQR